MIYDFTTGGEPGVGEVGGKGFSLMRMTRAGLPVPPGFNLPVEFFEPWLSELRSRPEWEALQKALREPDEDLSSSTNALKRVCENLELTVGQREQLDPALASLPDDALLAVRSSPPEEDLAGASFAGGYETTLGVTKETLPDALRSSFASTFDERVFVYKREQGFSVEDPRIAVNIFYLTLGEISAANADPAYDLRKALAERLPFYQKLKRVDSFPHLIDSRGRTGQVEAPHEDHSGPDVYSGLGVSRGTATGRIKVLQTPREKPVEKGDVLIAYTTDPGWTTLFVNAEAVVLEVGGMLQHGGVVAREYGKPCVAGIQGVTTKLKDGQKVEADGTTGVVRLLE